MSSSAGRWIPIATLAGFGLALSQALGLTPDPPGSGLAEAVAAEVNGIVIPREEWARAVEAVARDKRNPMTEADRQRALDTLITEELLVQQAETIGLMHADRGVRKAVVDAMLQYVLAGAADEPPADDLLRLYYLRNPEIGAVPLQLRLRVARADGDGKAAADRLAAGEAFGAVFDTALPVPDARLPVDALDSYLPVAVIEAARALQAGDIAGPIDAGEPHFVWVQERVEASRRPFEAVRETVARAWHREKRERAAARYIAELREAAEIRRQARF